MVLDGLIDPGLVIRSVSRNQCQWTVDLTATRAGLLLCGDLEIARKIISAEPQAPGDLSVDQKMRELVLFSVSDNYTALRSALGVAVGQDQALG